MICWNYFILKFMKYLKKGRDLLSLANRHSGDAMWLRHHDL